TFVAEWLFDAMRMFRESLGESALPGKDGRWRPKACTEAIVLPRPLNQPVEQSGRNDAVGKAGAGP
ncbi:MAG: hypothetical protein JWO15_3068, partial [Sphingomonadales bacterium]|nr:hypothetical protein [Sphingomonadales bacterium]